MEIALPGKIMFAPHPFDILESMEIAINKGAEKKYSPKHPGIYQRTSNRVKKDAHHIDDGAPRQIIFVRELVYSCSCMTTLTPSPQKKGPFTPCDQKS